MTQATQTTQAATLATLAEAQAAAEAIGATVTRAKRGYTVTIGQDTQAAATLAAVGAILAAAIATQAEAKPGTLAEAAEAMNEAKRAEAEAAEAARAEALAESRAQDKAAAEAAAAKRAQDEAAKAEADKAAKAAAEARRIDGGITAAARAYLSTDGDEDTRGQAAESAFEQFSGRPMNGDEAATVAAAIASHPLYTDTQDTQAAPATVRGVLAAILAAFSEAQDEDTRATLAAQAEAIREAAKAEALAGTQDAEAIATPAGFAFLATVAVPVAGGTFAVPFIMAEAEAGRLAGLKTLQAALTLGSTKQAATLAAPFLPSVLAYLPALAAELFTAGHDAADSVRLAGEYRADKRHCIKALLIHATKAAKAARLSWAR